MIALPVQHREPLLRAASERLEELRLRLEGDHDEHVTAKLRGRIAECRHLIKTVAEAPSPTSGSY